MRYTGKLPCVDPNVGQTDQCFWEGASENPDLLYLDRLVSFC